MKNLEFSWKLFEQLPIVGIIRGLTMEQVVSILPLFHRAGLTTIEITMNTGSAADIIRYASDHFGNQLNIGAGTVCDLAELELALESGAQFIVTPVLVEEVILSCVERNIPVFPGTYTPSEIFKAWKLGAPIIKIFPATSLAPQFIRDVKGPLNQVKLMPTGGVTLDNLQEFLEAGAQAFGVGSHLFDPHLIRSGNWDKLEEHFRKFTDHFALSSEPQSKIV